VDNWSSQKAHFTGLNHITGITSWQVFLSDIKLLKPLEPLPYCYSIASFTLSRDDIVASVSVLTALYQIETLATISSRDKVNDAML
jgi:hypothetical protein